MQVMSLLNRSALGLVLCAVAVGCEGTPDGAISFPQTESAFSGTWTGAGKVLYQTNSTNQAQYLCPVVRVTLKQSSAEFKASNVVITCTGYTTGFDYTQLDIVDGSQLYLNGLRVGRVSSNELLVRPDATANEFHLVLFRDAILPQGPLKLAVAQTTYVEMGAGIWHQAQLYADLKRE